MHIFGLLGVFLCLLVIWLCPLPISATERTALVLSDKAAHDDETDVSVEDLIDSASGLAENVFIPTREWQTIKPGQAIPRGLHVRLNLATGEKEAKLPDDQKSEEIQYWESEDGKRGMMNADGSKTFTRDQLKRALKKFDVEAEDQDQESDEAVKNKFRSYEELKKDLEQLRMQVKSDLEVMTELLTEFKKPDTSDDRKVVVLEDLEYLVHQIDNAQNFVDMGGFTLLSQLLNTTDPRYREWAAFIVGSATQSNPKVQIAALENGIMHHLIRTFHLEESSSVRRKYLFALSAILRNFPLAQKKFIELGGFEALGDILRKTTTDEKHKFKIITLLSDLLHERLEIEHRAATYSSPSPIHHHKELLTKLGQYREAPLAQAMLDGGWCKLVGDLLSTPDMDNQEKVLRAMEVMLSECKTDFDAYLPRMKELGGLYRNQVASDHDNEYLEDLLVLVQDMLSKFGSGVKDEL